MSDLDAATLADLAARVEAASGPDRELDFLIANALYQIGGEAWGYAACDIHPENGPEVVRLTASLDAALALVERVLPEWRVVLDSDHDRAPLWRAAIKPRRDVWSEHSMAPTPALAVLSALLAALAKQEGRGE